jgi:hypothetical protein
MRSDMDWFKLRLNQVERERAHAHSGRLGVKIAVPEFVPTYEDPGQCARADAGLRFSWRGRPAGRGRDRMQSPVRAWIIH